jgi:hypothetical protein
MFKPSVTSSETDPSKPQSPAMAVLDTAQPLQVEGGEGRIHEMTARHARLAMREALVEAKGNLVKAADVRPVIKAYPWASLGAAAGVGFLTAVAAVPSKKSRAASRLRAIERALAAEGAMGTAKVGGRKKATAGSRLFRLAWRFAKPAVISAITSAATGAASGAAGAKASAAGSDSPGTSAPPEPAVADVT